MAQEIHHGQQEKGFYGFSGESFNIDQKLLLVVGEVAEAHEEIRSNNDPHYTYYSEDNKPEGFEFELADVLIRVLDLAGALNIDIGARVDEKLAYNESRPYMHGRKF
jgi:NTP pyrophosphatase (non-canonical NTP hydrolase)